MEKLKIKSLTKTNIFYNDTIWFVFYFMNVLYSLGRVMIKYNYSSVSDSNPISVALHGGIYIVCAGAVYKLCKTFKSARCSIMEVMYFGLKIFYFCWQFSENFVYLVIARIVCVVIGVFISHTIFKPIYKNIDKGYNRNFMITIPAIIISLIVFVVVYHKYVLLMIWGAFISVICIKLLAVQDAGVSVSTGRKVIFGSKADDNSQKSNRTDNSNDQSEMINFNEYDFTKGNISEDIDKIRF